ncbi:MAG: DUF3450 domain-containing protein [Pseudomonadota bacterium]
MTIYLHRVLTLPLIAAGFGTFFLQLSTPTFAQTVDEALQEHEQMQQTLRASQARIDDLDDQTLDMLAEYRSELRRLEDLNSYNENLQELLNSQVAEQQRITEDLAELEAVRRDLVPLMLEMQRAMDDFVRLDLPFLPEERAARVQALDNLLKRSDVDIAEKYRRLIEAYIIEAEYGQTLEAYEGMLDTAGQQRTVDFLRLGRTALYYITLDRTEVGIWDIQVNDWHALPDSFVDPVMLAIRMARQQVPPDLVRLPLPQPQPAGNSQEVGP